MPSKTVSVPSVPTIFKDHADSKLYKSNFIRIEQYETGTSP